MPNDLEDSAQWRDRVESRLGTLEATVGEQAGLRAAMDEDMGDLKAEFGIQKKLIEAVRDTQSDHTKRLTALETGVQETKARVGAVEARVGAVEARLGVVETRVGAVEARLGVVEATLKKVHVGVDAILALLGGKHA
jgi:DNA repair ATPase RecN